LSSQGASGFFF